MTSDVYDNTGAVYDTARVIAADNTLNIVAYRKYSPPFLGATFAFVYGLSFTSVLTHIGFWHAKDLWAALKGRNRLDIHARLVRTSYRQTPWYWYAGNHSSDNSHRHRHRGSLPYQPPRLRRLPRAHHSGSVHGPLRHRARHNERRRKPVERLIRVHWWIPIRRPSAREYDFQDPFDGRCWSGCLFCYGYEVWRII